ncbi:MAG: dienelactone hydrolase family protein [Ilumatobacteraceae bacterium]
MAEVLLFHHVCGVTPGIVEFAESLRAAGHTVHVPDLFDGQRFESIDEGVAFVESIGFDAIVQRGLDAAASLSTRLVYAGVSLGVVPAQHLAQTRDGAVGAVLIASCVPHETFSPAWPAGVPVQVHGMDADPFFSGEGDIDAARALVASTTDASLFVYEGDQHLFVDSSLPDFVPDAAALVTDRTLALLAAR